MIIELFMTVYIMLVGLINKVLPDWSFPDAYITSLSNLFVYARSLDELFPMRAIIGVILFSISFEFAYIGYKALSGLISLIRGGGKMDV